MAYVQTLNDEPNLHIQTRRESLVLRPDTTFPNHLFLYEGSVELSYELLARLLVALEDDAELRATVEPTLEQHKAAIRAEINERRAQRAERRVVASFGTEEQVMPAGEHPDQFALNLLRRGPHTSVSLHVLSDDERRELGPDWSLKSSEQRVTYCLTSDHKVWRMPPLAIRMSGDTPELIHQAGQPELITPA